MSDPHADEQTLRDSLALIASAIDDDTGSRETRPVPELESGNRRTPRRRWWVAGAAAAAVAACVTAVLISRDSPAIEADHEREATTSAQSETEWVACAEYIVEGTVTSVGAGDPNRIALTIEVADWVKPDRGASTLEVRVRDPKAVGLAPIVRGQRYLFVIPANRRLAPDVFGEEFITDYRRIVDRVSAQAADTKCPQYWQTADGS